MRTKAGIATTPGRPQSIRTTPTVGTCRRVPGRSPLTAAATRRHCSIGDAGREPGDRSVEDCPSPCRRCPMRSSPRGDSSSPASPTGRSGRATTAETAGPRCGSTATSSLHSSLWRTPATDTHNSTLKRTTSNCKIGEGTHERVVVDIERFLHSRTTRPGSCGTAWLPRGVSCLDRQRP